MKIYAIKYSNDSEKYHDWSVLGIGTIGYYATEDLAIKKLKEQEIDPRDLEDYRLEESIRNNLPMKIYTYKRPTNGYIPEWFKFWIEEIDVIDH